MAISFKGGVRAGARRDKTVNCESKPVNSCRTLVFCLKGRNGVTYIPEVKAGDEVKAGQRIAYSADSWELPLHSSASGRIDTVSEDRITLINNELYETVEAAAPNANDEKALILALQNSGIADMDGGEFICGDTLAGTPPKYLIVDAMQSEQYASSLCRRAAEDPREVIKGVRTIQKLFKARSVYICVSENARESEEAIRGEIRYDESINILMMKYKYPQQDKSVLVRSVTGRELSTAMQEGCIVTNAEIMYNVCRTVEKGLPVTERIVTVGGSAVLEPDNFRVPFGVPVSFMIKEAKGYIDPPERIVINGLMSGYEVKEDDVLDKNSVSIQAMLTEKQRRRTGSCIRCGRCAAACPEGLLPYKLNASSVDFKVDTAIRYDIFRCSSCGVCTNVCPAGLNISENIEDMTLLIKRIRGMEAETENE